MKRGGPPRRDPDKARAWEQRSRGNLRRGAPIQRTSKTPNSTRKTSPTPDPVTAATKAAVDQRSGGMCEARAARHCTGGGEHRHHRKLRRHNDHRPCNLLHVCHVCHTEIHGNPTRAYEAGWMVRGHDDPAEVLVNGRSLQPG